MTVQLKIMQNQHRYLSFDIESKYAKIRDFQNLLSMVFGHLPFLDPTSVCLQCESRTERMFWIPRVSSCTQFWLLKGLHIPAAHTFEASKCKQEAIQPVHLCCTLLRSWPAWIKTRGLQLTHQFSSFRPLRGHPANLSSKK